MKKLIILLFLFPLFCFSQTDSLLYRLPYKDGKITYENIEEVKGLSKDFIYGFSKKWVMNKFSQQLSRPIKTEDSETGQIISRVASAPIYLSSESIISQQIFLNFWIQIDCREEKYRIRFFEFTSLRPSSLFLKGNIPLEDYDIASEKNRNKNNTGTWDIFSLKINSYLNGLLKDFQNNLIDDSKNSF